MNSFADEIIPLGMTGDYINGLGFKENDWSSEGLPIIRIQNLTNSAKPFNRTLREVDDRFKVQNGDILVSWSATLDAFIWRRGAAILNQHIFKVVPDTKRVDPGFLFYQLKSIIWQMSHGEHAHGSTMKHINRKPFLSHPFWCPALSQQREIAIKLDRSFSGLENSEKQLLHLQAKLKQARASILKAAVEGRLVETEAELARRNATDYENAEALLQRSLAEKKRLFQEAQLQAGRRKTWKEPSRPECHDTSSKPEGWTITSMEQIADVSGGLAKDSNNTSGESLPYLRVANVQRGKLDLEHIKTITCPSEKVYGLLLKKGDVLLNEGGDRDKLGRGWVWNGEISRCIHQNHVFKARLALPAIQPRFISHYCNTLGESYFQNEGKQTTNLASISLSKVRALPISLPPASEQLRILEEIDRRFSVLDQVEATIQTSLTRCGMLRQAILKQAFEGRLVQTA